MPTITTTPNELALPALHRSFTRPFQAMVMHVCTENTAKVEDSGMIYIYIYIYIYLVPGTCFVVHVSAVLLFLLLLLLLLTS